MIERNGQMFYTADDVNLDRVHEAMTAAGRRDRALPLEQLGNSGWAEMRRRGSAPDGSRGRSLHDYGPHRPEDAPELKPIAVRVNFAWRHVPVNESFYTQRAYINTLAHEAAQRRKAAV